MKRTANRLTLVVVLFSALLTLLFLVGPLYALQLFDQILVSGQEEALIHLTAAAIVLLGALGLLEHYRGQLLIRLGTVLSNTFDRVLFSGALGASNRGAPAHLKPPLRDLETVTDFLASLTARSLPDAVLSPLLLAIILVIHPVLGAVAAGGMALFVLLALVMDAVSRERVKADHDHRSRSQHVMESSLRGAPAIEAMGMAGRVREKWLGAYRRATDAQMIISERSNFLRGCLKFLHPALHVALLGVGAYFVMRDEITIGAIIAASVILMRILSPLEHVASRSADIRAAWNAYQRLRGFLDRYCQPLGEMVRRSRPKGAITVDKLYGSPPGVAQTVLSDLSFTVSPGEILGITGPSGAGKTTLAHMLIGIWAPSSGRIRLDGADIVHWARSDLGNHVGFVPQECEVLDGTIGQNIARFGSVDAEAVAEAARLAGIHEFVSAQADGYDTVIGDEGVRLSAGQRQRIHLARAIYGAPALLILDEPNTHLDGAGELRLIDMIKALKARGTTIIVISHRRPLLALGDRIMVLRAGRIEMLATASEVIARLSRGSGPKAASVPVAAVSPG